MHHPLVENRTMPLTLSPSTICDWTPGLQEVKKSLSPLQMPRNSSVQACSRHGLLAVFPH